MKTRNGFVSNSSSSSFVVIMKNGKELSKEILLEIFDVKKTSPLYSFAKDLSDWIIDNLKEKNISGIYDNFCGTSKGKIDEEMINKLVEDCNMNQSELEKIVSKEYRYYSGSASDDSDDALESYLCENEMKIETDDIKISGGGSY